MIYRRLIMIRRRDRNSNILPTPRVFIDFESKSQSFIFYKQLFSFVPLFCFTILVT